MIIDCHNHIGTDAVLYAQNFYPYAQDLESLVRHAGELGVDRWVVFPFVNYRGLILDGQEVWPRSHGESPVPYAAENARLFFEVDKLFPELGKRTIPFVMLDPSRDPSGQVGELRALREQHRPRGFKIQATIIRSFIRDLLEDGACLMDLAEEWDLPVLIHSSILPSDLWSQAADILDVVERRPQIRFCVAHSCRFDKPSLDRLATLPNAWFDCSAHIIHCRLAHADSPVVAVPDRRVPAEYGDPAAVLATLHTLYPQRLLWGSDSPYQSYVDANDPDGIDLFCTYREEVDALMAQTPGAREQMAHRNTLAFLGSAALA